ncbi:13882_t:CDS:2 [Ambispora leptoticha]|uniref:13882_t:CDS:1 n=1 Tax=Ambispora leptoticha TaxID=144679 RepID=A0A9N9BKS9_9GLOM|nr:13882_t:CDS:2 [Ambispora leptoticha]
MSKRGKEVHLISDILQIIFTTLNCKDLFSVILVNRTWCRIGIPILWKAPFGYRRTGYKKYAIRTYLLSISEPSLNYLKVIPYLPRNSILPKASEEFEGSYVNLGIMRKPLFDYISYCLMFDYGGMISASVDYCETLNSLSKRKTAKIIMKILLEMFKARGHQFKIMRVKCSNDISFWSSLEYASLFSEIDTLKLAGKDIHRRDVLTALILLCQKIKHLKISINFSPDTLIALIRVQTNLATIKIFGSLGTQQKSLLSALCTQKNTITSIQFSYFPFEDFTDWSIFQQFAQLKLLRITNFTVFPDTDEIDTINDIVGAKCMITTTSTFGAYGSMPGCTLVWKFDSMIGPL